MTCRSDEELMLIYAERDDRCAFEELYRRHAGMLIGLARRSVRLEADAEDLVQHTFLRVVRARASFRAGEKFKPWLVTILMNLCRDRTRRNGRRPEVRADVDRFAGEPARESDAADVRTQVESALGTLEETIRTILVQHYYEERRLCDIANDLGLNPSTVRVRAHRACSSLRSQLKEAS